MTSQNETHVAASHSACPRANRLRLPMIEQVYDQIIQDVNNFPLSIVGELLGNPVGSERALTAVKAAIEYSKKTETRFVVSAADGEALLDTYKSVEQHESKYRKQIHDNMFLRAIIWKANDSACPEFFTEQKYSYSTNRKELYAAVRIGLDAENTIGHVRGSKASTPF